MPPPISAKFNDGREFVRLGGHERDHDHDSRHAIDIGHADLTRYGPDLAGVGMRILAPPSAFSPSNDRNGSKDACSRTTGEFRLPRSQHNATHSIATSVASTESDGEAIELYALRRTDRAQPFIGFSGLPASHGRFDSTASSYTTTSYSSTSASEDEFIYGNEIGVRSAVRPSLEQADRANQPRPAQPVPRPGSQDVHITAEAEESLDNRISHESTPPSTPMSPRQTRFPQRLYVPEATGRDNGGILANNFSEVDINSPSAPSPARHSPDSEHTLSAETDSLLPAQKFLSRTELPLPATSPTCDEPSSFRLSYSLFESIFYLFGFSITTALVVLSVWLTLANIVM